MKSEKIIYWSTTIFLGIMQGAAGAMNFFSPVPAERFKMLGYPPHLLIVLGFAEILGVLALMLPQVSFRIKEWAYAGFLFLYISALVAHIAANDSLFFTIQPVISFVILAISYIYFHRLNKVFVEKVSE